MLLKAQTNKQTNKKTKGVLSHSRRRKEHFVFYFPLLLVHPPNASYVFFKRAKHGGASLFDHRFLLHNLKKKTECVRQIGVQLESHTLSSRAIGKFNVKCQVLSTSIGQKEPHFTSDKLGQFFIV